jgi:TRAP-type C4-dicarboxylate transport system permease small subunit
MKHEEKSGIEASSFFDKMIGFLVYVGAAILAFFALAVCWDVIARAVFRVTLSWVLEFTEYALLYMTFLCTAWVLRKEGHVVTDLLLVALNPRKQALLNTVSSILGASVCLVLTWVGAEVSWDHLRRGLYQPTPIQTPDFPLFVVIPFGSFLLFIQFLRRTKKNFSKLKEVPGDWKE